MLNYKCNLLFHVNIILSMPRSLPNSLCNQNFILIVTSITVVIGHRTSPCILILHINHAAIRSTKKKCKHYSAGSCNVHQALLLNPICDTDTCYFLSDKQPPFLLLLQPEVVPGWQTVNLFIHIQKILLQACSCNISMLKI